MHTPREWHESKTGNHQGLILDETGSTIAVCYDKANAPIIVQAVNSYAALVAALELAVRYLEYPDVEALPFAMRSEYAADRARAALALAKGE